MLPTRQVRLFRNNQSQAVRIPRDWELPGTEAIITKDGDRLILEPEHGSPIERLLAWLETLAELPEDEQMPPIEDPPPEPVTNFDER